MVLLYFNIFLFSDCTILRKDNNLYLQRENEVKKPFPIKIIEVIYCIGKVNIDSLMVDFLVMVFLKALNRSIKVVLFCYNK